MAKKPTANLEEDERTLIERASIRQELRDDEERQLADYVRDTGMRGGQVEISRKRPLQAKPGYLVTLAPEDATEENIASLYGGGEYYCKLRTSEGAYFGHTGFSVDMSRKGSIELNADVERKKEASVNGHPTVQVMSPEAKNSDTLFMQFMAMMQAQQEAAAARSDNMMMMMQKQSADSMASFAAMVQALKPEAAPKSEFQFKDMLPIVLELFKSKSSLKEHVETMKALQDLNADGKDEPDMLEKLISKFGPMAAQLLAAKMQSPPPSPGMMTLPPADGQPVVLSPSASLEGGAGANSGTNRTAVIPQPETSAGGSSLQPPVVKEPFGILWMDPQARLYLGAILKAARTQKDPAFYAEFIEDVLDESRWFDLIDNMKKENWYPTLFGDSPEFASQKQWLDQLRTELLRLDEEMKEPAEVETETVQAEPEIKVESARKKAK